MASIAAEAGLSSFIQAFSAVDAVGSRRRREKLLDARLEEEREFRAANLEFAQNREQRAQEAADESAEERELRLEADAIGLDPDSTDEELREAALRSPGAAEAINRRRNQRAFVGLTDAALARQQVAAQQAGATEEDTAVTAQPSGLSAQQFRTQLPSDPRMTREISLSELEKQAGRKAPTQGKKGGVGVRQQERIGLTVAMPSDWKTEAQINAMPDRRAAQTLRDRQKAEAIELLESRDLSVGATTEAQERSKGERADLNTQWLQVATVTDTKGDFKRNFIQEHVTAGVADYFENRTFLSKGVREAADKFMAPIAMQAWQDQRTILDDPELDPMSRDAANARRKYKQAISVGYAIGLSAAPAKDSGIRASGLPQGEEELAEQYRVAMIAAPKLPGALPPNKERQIEAQLRRNIATPAKRLSRNHLNNLFLAAQGGWMSMDQALYAATHGGATQGGLPETFSHDPKKDLYVKYPGGVQIIRAARDPSGQDTDINRNILEAAGSDLVKTYYDQFNTDDDSSRGTGYMFAAMGILRRIEDKANAHGFSYNNTLDIQQLLTRITQTVLIKDRFNAEWMIGTDFNPEFSDYFGEIEDAIFSKEFEQFIASKQEEGFFNEFKNQPLTAIGGQGDNIAGFKQALVNTNDPRAALVAGLSQEETLAFMQQEADVGR